MRYFFLRRVASYLLVVVYVVVVIVVLAVVVYFFIFAVGRGLLLWGIFFSDALRRILFLLLLMFIISLDLGLGGGFYYGLIFLRRVASHLVLVVVDVYHFIRFGVGRGLLLWAIFSPTRCVASCSCCC